MPSKPSADTLALLAAFDGAAAVFDADGEVAANRAFEALPERVRRSVLAGETLMGWRTQALPSGLQLAAEICAPTRRLLAQERFLATLSHEIRTPLNGVLGMTGLLERTQLNHTQKDYLSALRASGEHLIGLVNDVLDYAKLDVGHIEFETAPTDVERLLQGVCELLSPRAHASGLEIAWACKGAPGAILADDGRLRQILFNLAGNAVKMTREGGVLVTVEGRGLSGGRIRLRFSVRDTGPGLPPELHDRVFEEFVQTEDGVRAGGTGLGLAIVKRLVVAMGGQLGVDSQPGKGATFWFEADFGLVEAEPEPLDLTGRLVAVVSSSPIVRKAAVAQVAACGGRALAYRSLREARTAPEGAVLLIDAPGDDRAPEPPPAAGPAIVLLPAEARDRIERYRAAGYAGYLIKPLRRVSLSQRVLATQLDEQAAAASPSTPAVEDDRVAPAGALGARVLLAEDNAVNAMLAKVLLTREGCTVERVANGEEAVEAVRSGPFDVVLMDMRMPVMDGLEAVRRIRALGLQVPVVALTANAFDDDRRNCLEAGMNDFLTKPIEPSALRAALARWTSPPGEAKLAS